MPGMALGSISDKEEEDDEEAGGVVVAVAHHRINAAAERTPIFRSIFPI